MTFAFLSYVLSIISHVFGTVQVHNGFSTDTECFTPHMMSWQEHILYTIAHFSRLSVSLDDRHALAVPLDNSHIKLYDLAGNRLAHLPRRGGQVGFSKSA